MIRSSKIATCLLCLTCLASLTKAPVHAEENPTASLQLRIPSADKGKPHSVPAVIWLDPLPGTPASPFSPHGRYTLLQKNRTFIPHLQVIPVGAVVQFPNADPFFHNVFSKFQGKQFDLGLYEAGSTKSVAFPREGISYIFCNIHPEMSAVVIVLPTSLYAIADESNAFTLHNIPPGDYELHLWIEGVPETTLARETRRVHLPPHLVDLGTVAIPMSGSGSTAHANKFGKPYPPESKQPY